MSAPFEQIGKLVENVQTWNPRSAGTRAGFLYIDLSAVDQEKKCVHAASQIDCAQAPSRARQLVSEGDVLVSTVRPNLNGVAYVTKVLDGATASTGFCVLRPKPTKLFSRYLFHWVQSPAFVMEMTKRATGQSYPAVSDAIIKSSRLPLPPLEEQKRIAEILDKADALRRKRQEALRLADDFLQSVFLDMFGDPVTNPKGWPAGKIRDLSAETQYGTSSKAGTTGKFPILRMNNITSTGGWALNDLKYIDLPDRDAERYFVHAGDILFNRTNSPDLVGKTAVFREDRPMAFAGYLVRLRTNEKANPEYVSAFLNSRRGKAVLRSMCKSIIGMANINAQELLNISILHPPRPLQDQFAEIVAKTLNTKRSMACSADNAESLANALSRRSFEGEL